MTAIETTPRQRTLARLAAGATGRYGRAISAYPVIVIPTGSLSPRLIGRSYHWTTPGGRPVHYPNAYRRAWGKPVYHGSTLRVVVGEEWLKAQSAKGGAA